MSDLSLPRSLLFIVNIIKISQRETYLVNSTKRLGHGFPWNVILPVHVGDKCDMKMILSYLGYSCSAVLFNHLDYAFLQTEIAHNKTFNLNYSSPICNSPVFTFKKVYNFVFFYSWDLEWDIPTE